LNDLIDWEFKMYLLGFKGVKYKLVSLPGAYDVMAGTICGSHCFTDMFNAELLEIIDDLSELPSKRAEDVIHLFEDYDAELKELYSKSAQVEEDYTLREHTIMVIGQYLKYYANNHTSEDRLFFIKLLALHDIGKPIAKKTQHLATIGMLSEGMDRFFHEHERSRAVALIAGDPIGDYFQKNEGVLSAPKFVRKTANRIIRMAKLAGMPVEEFMRYLCIYATCDMAAYTEDAECSSLDSGHGMHSLDRMFNRDGDGFSYGVAEDMLLFSDNARLKLYERYGWGLENPATNYRLIMDVLKDTVVSGCETFPEVSEVEQLIDLDDLCLEISPDIVDTEYYKRTKDLVENFQKTRRVADAEQKVSEGYYLNGDEYTCEQYSLAEVQDVLVSGLNNLRSLLIKMKHDPIIRLFPAEYRGCPFRADTRNPDQIREAGGFVCQDPREMGLTYHVGGSCATTTTSYKSAFVSTGISPASFIASGDYGKRHEFYLYQLKPLSHGIYVPQAIFDCKYTMFDWDRLSDSLVSPREIDLYSEMEAKWLYSVSYGASEGEVIVPFRVKADDIVGYVPVRRAEPFSNELIIGAFSYF
jgi:hypothetical protein